MGARVSLPPMQRRCDSLFKALGISVGGEVTGPLVTSFVGAVVLLFVVGLLKQG